MHQHNGKIEIDLLDACDECKKKECELKKFIEKNIWLNIIVKICDKIELQKDK